MGADSLHVAFRYPSDTVPYKYVLEAAPTVSRPWEIVGTAALRRAAPPAAFEFAVPHPYRLPNCFFRVRHAGWTPAG